MYKIEDEIRKQSLSGETKRAYRLGHSKPIVDGPFEWAENQRQRMALLPSAPFTNALNSLLNQRIELQVFFEHPDVAPDTNHVEPALRPIPMGRKAWLFCWSEVGAEYVGG